MCALVLPAVALVLLCTCVGAFQPETGSGATGAGNARPIDMGPPSYPHSLYPPYLHSAFENENWDFGGSTVVKVYDQVRLTSDQPSQSGWLAVKRPLKASSWAIEFDFKIHGTNKKVFGDGFAFWFTRDKFQQGTVFGGADRFTGLAVFFDTYGNAKHAHSFPYVSAMVGDGRTAYDHERDNEATIAGQGCEASIRGDGIDTIKARVTYFENRVLELELMDATRVWKKCFAVSNVNLPAKGYIAFSAATGGVTDNHDIMRVTTYANMEKKKYDQQDTIDSTIHQDIGTDHTLLNIARWFYHTFLFILQWGLVAAVVGGLYWYYKRSQRHSNKSF